MKVLVVLAVCAVSVASAGRYAAGPLAAVSTGTSSQFRQEDNYGNYQFGYDEAHSTGGSSRREEQTGGVRRGSYSLNDADGRHRVVNYIADASGFRATVQTNEPGVEPKDPADVLINKAAPVLAAPVLAAPVLAAPAPLALPAPAPIKSYGYARAPLAAAAPLPLAAPAYPAGPVYAAAPALVAEPATPRAFSYSFGASHIAPASYAAPAPLALPAPLPIAAPAPVYQQRLEY